MDDIISKIYTLAIIENNTIRQVADKLSLSWYKVSDYIKKHPEWNYKKKRVDPSKIVGRTPKKTIKFDKTKYSKEYLFDLYWNQHKTLREICTILNCERSSLTKYINELEIPIRKNNNKNLNQDELQKINDKNYLFNEHHNNNKSIIKIANELNTSDVNILKKFKLFNISKKQEFGNYIWNIFKTEDLAKDTLIELNENQSLTDIAEKYNVSISCVSLWFKKFNIKPKQHFISKPQNDLAQYLTNILNTEIEQNNRNIIKPKEIDIWIKEYNLGIEVDGIRWHTTQFISDTNYHMNKQKAAQVLGIRFMAFYDTELENKNDIVKSIILSYCNINIKRIYARKTKIIKIQQKEATNFYNKNHIQGSTYSKYHYGLLYDNELVSVMSFTPSRFDKNISYELTRFCSLLYTNVIGGASKLFSEFIKEYNPESIISYADKRIFTGNLYNKLGFQSFTEVKPNYNYLIENKLIRKEHFRHKNLKNILENYDINLSEQENMLNHGYFRLYDYGKLKFIWYKNQ